MKALKIVIVGPPGSGKETQGKELAKKCSLQYIGYRMCLVHHLTKKTELGNEFRPFYIQKKAIPGDLMNRMLHDVIDSKKGFVIKGYPITESQTTSFIEEFSPDLCIFIRVPELVSRERLSYRRIDPETRIVYNVLTDPPPDENNISARMRRMKSDSPLNINKRCTSYDNSDFENAVVKKYFKNNVIEIDGTKKKEELYEEINNKVNKFLKEKNSVSDYVPLPTKNEKEEEEEEGEERAGPQQQQQQKPTKEQILKRVEEITSLLLLSDKKEKEEEEKKDHQTLYLERSDLYIQLGEKEKASEDCEKAIEIYPNFNAYIMRTGLHLEDKNYDLALNNCQKAMDHLLMKNDDDDDESYDTHLSSLFCIKAIIFREIDKIEESNEFIKKAIEKNENVAMKILLQYIESKVEEGEEERNNFEESIKLCDYFASSDIIDNLIIDKNWIGLIIRTRGYIYSQKMKNHHEKAIEDFNLVIEKYPDLVHETVYYWRCTSHRALKKHNEVIKDSTIIIDEYSTDDDNDKPIIFFFRGEAFVWLQKYQEGIIDLEKSIEMIKNNKSSNIYVIGNETLGLSYYKLNNFEKSYECYMNCIRNNHENSSIYFCLSMINELRSRWEESLSCYKNCLRLDPLFPGARRRKAILHLKLNQWGNAEQDYSIIIEQLKKEILVINNNFDNIKFKELSKFLLLDCYSRAICYYSLGKFELCVKEFNFIDHESFEMEKKGVFLIKEEEEEESQQNTDENNDIYKNLTRSYLMNQEFYKKRYECYKRMGEKEKALDELNKCIKLFPVCENDLAIEKGHLYFSLKDYDVAIENFTKYLNHSPLCVNEQKFMVYNEIGFCYRRKGENEKAIEIYNKSLENNSILNDGAIRGRGMAYTMLKEYKKALQDFSTAIKMLTSSNPLIMMVLPQSMKVNLSSALNSRGYVYTMLKEYEKAIENFNKALEIRPDGFSNPFNHRGYVYFLTADYENAMKDFAKALQINPNYKQAIQRQKKCMAKMEERERIRFLIDHFLMVNEKKIPRVVLQSTVLTDNKILLFQWNLL